MYDFNYWPLCPFSREVRLTLLLEGVPHRTQQQTPEATLDLLPEHPVLIEKNLHQEELSWFGRNSIIAYLQEETSYVQQIPFADQKTLEFCDLVHHTFYPRVTLPFISERASRLFTPHVQKSPNSALLRQAHNSLTRYLDYFDWCYETSAWIAGDHFSFADIALMGQLSLLDYLGVLQLENFALLAAWYYRIKSQPYFRPFLSDYLTHLPPHTGYGLLDL